MAHLALTGNYNFENNRGDWVDWQQTMYLCDPNIRFLTQESAIKRNGADSPQAARILLFDELADQYRNITNQRRQSCSLIK